MESYEWVALLSAFPVGLIAGRVMIARGMWRTMRAVNAVSVAVGRGAPFPPLRLYLMAESPEGAERRARDIWR